MKFLCRIPLLVIAALAWLPAQAASFERFVTQAPGCDQLRGESLCIAVALHEEIQPGDSAALAEFIDIHERTLSNSNSGRVRVGVLYLNSPGGSITEAMKIARTVRQRQIAVHVPKDYRCASACVLVLAGGVKRAAIGPTEIHSFYSPRMQGSGQFEQASREFDQVAEAVEKFLREMRVPRRLLDEMIKVPPSRSKLLSLDEKVDLGLIGIDPVYAQTKK